MKNFAVVLIVLYLFFCFGCSTTKTNSPCNEIKDELFDCFVEKYQKEGIDVLKALKQLEELAIETQNLKDCSSSSYFQMFEIAAEKNSFPFVNKDDFFKGVMSLKNFPLNFTCDDFENDNSFKVLSKFNKLTEKIAERMENNRTEKIDFCELIIEVFDISDFDSLYVRYSLLTFVAWQEYSLNSIQRNLRFLR